MRSISLASDGSCLVAGSVKVGSAEVQRDHALTDIGVGEMLRMEDQRREIRSAQISGGHYVPSPQQVPHPAPFEP